MVGRYGRSSSEGHLHLQCVNPDSSRRTHSRRSHTVQSSYKQRPFAGAFHGYLFNGYKRIAAQAPYFAIPFAVGSSLFTGSLYMTMLINMDDRLWRVRLGKQYGCVFGVEGGPSWTWTPLDCLLPDYNCIISLSTLSNPSDGANHTRANSEISNRLPQLRVVANGRKGPDRAKFSTAFPSPIPVPTSPASGLRGPPSTS